MKLIKATLIYFGLSLFAFLAVSCNLPALGNSPHAWIDAPLDASALPINTKVDVISHSNDLSGITNVELSINDVILSTDAVPDSGQVYVLMSQPWTPTQAGSYQVRVRAQTGSGQWSDYALVTVTVGNASGIRPILTESPTSVFTSSPTPKSSSSLTPIPLNPTFTLKKNAFCRKGPDPSFPDITAIPNGAIVDIQGVSMDGFWYFIFWKQFNAKCWVAAAAGQVSGNLAALPILVSPNTPTPPSVSPTARKP